MEIVGILIFIIALFLPLGAYLFYVEFKDAWFSVDGSGLFLGFPIFFLTVFLLTTASNFMGIDLDV